MRKYTYLFSFFVLCCFQSFIPVSPAIGSDFIITHPVSGDVLVAGTYHTIKWTTTLPPTQRIAIIAKHAKGQCTLVDGIPNTGSYRLEVPIPDAPTNALRDGFSIDLIPSNTINGSVAAIIGKCLLKKKANPSPQNPSQSISQTEREISFNAAEQSQQKNERSLSVLPADSEDKTDVTVGFGSLAGFTALGEYVWLDVIKGTNKVVGTVSELNTLIYGGIAVDDIKKRVYLLDDEDMYKQKVYVIDSFSGKILKIIYVDRNEGLGFRKLSSVNGLGEIIGFRENGTKLDMVAINPVTATVASRGIVADIHWIDDSVINHRSNIIYVIGSNDNDSIQKICALNTLSGALISEISIDKQGPRIYGLAINSKNEIVGNRRNERNIVEFITINPGTGVTNVRGIVGDAWTGHFIGMNKIDNTYYMIGQPDSGVNAFKEMLYAVDALSGKLLYQVKASFMDSHMFLVY